MSCKYPVYQPYLGGNEKKYVIDCLETNWISSLGKYVDLFQNSFSEYTDIPYSSGVCNGTVALHLALEALGIGPGDEVVVPTLTYIAAVNCITYTGATPVFVDSSEDTWQMDPEDIRQKITSNTKAILCVHVYGHPCEMDTIMSIAKEHTLFVVEDCAEALGSRYQNKHVGNFGDVATFSFYGNKTITTGEGGMICTHSQKLFDKIIRLRGQGLAKNREYWHDMVGYNYRMTNICAAIGFGQMENIDSILIKKRQIANLYKDQLYETEFEFHKENKDVYHSYWMNTILIPEDMSRTKLRDFLGKNGIETRPMFYPIHTMPIYANDQEKHSVAEDISKRGLNLPSYSNLGLNDIKFISNCLKMFED